MVYFHHNINDIIDIHGTKYKLVENRIEQGKDKQRALTVITALSFYNNAIIILRRILSHKAFGTG